MGRSHVIRAPQGQGVELKGLRWAHRLQITARHRKGPRLVGRIGSGVRVSASFTSIPFTLHSWGEVGPHFSHSDALTLVQRDSRPPSQKKTSKAVCQVCVITHFIIPTRCNFYCATRMHSAYMPWQDVCPSVCLSHAGIVLKRLHISSIFFHGQVAQPF